MRGWANNKASTALWWWLPFGAEWEGTDANARLFKYNHRTLRERCFDRSEVGKQEAQLGFRLVW